MLGQSASFEPSQVPPSTTFAGKAAVPHYKAAAIIKATELQWAEEAPTASERTTRIREKSKELVETFAKRGQEGFEERLNLLMTETTRELREALPYQTQRF
jgi:hypothetical protein